MSTVITYNDIQLRNVVLEEFKQLPTRDGSSTDQLFSEFAITCEALVHLGSYNAAILGGGVIGVANPSGLAATSSQEVLNFIRARLTEDRQSFSLSMEGVEVLAATSETDVRNGPKVLRFDVVHVSSAMIRVKWSVQVCLTACLYGSGNAEWPVISNRWSVADDIDESNRSTRTWQGTLVLAHLPAIRTPHLFRHLCVPPLFPGWWRSSMRFIGEPSGLVLNYTVTDQQLSCEAPPYPAADYEITHSKKWNAVTTRQVENIQVTLTGMVQANRTYLAERAFQIIQSRGRFAVAADFNRRIMRDFGIVEVATKGGSRVTATVQIEHFALSNESPILGMVDLEPIGQVLTLPQPEDSNDPNYYDPNKSWWNGAPWGTGMGLLVSTLAAAWQTPCTTGHSNAQGGIIPSQPPTPETTQEAPTVTWQQGPAVEMQSPGIAEEAKDNPYNSARIESEIHTDFGWVGLPLASRPADVDGVVQQSTIGIQLHAPTTVRTLRCVFERIGAWPNKIIKAKQFTDSNGVVHWPMPRVMKTQAREKLPDGKDLYSIAIEYQFQLDREYADNQPIPVGVLPWDLLTPNDNRIPSSSFIDPDDNTKGIN